MQIFCLDLDLFIVAEFELFADIFDELFQNLTALLSLALRNQQVSLQCRTFLSI